MCIQSSITFLLMCAWRCAARLAWWYLYGQVYGFDKHKQRNIHKSRKVRFSLQFGCDDLLTVFLDAFFNAIFMFAFHRNVYMFLEDLLNQISPRLMDCENHFFLKMVHP